MIKTVIFDIGNVVLFFDHEKMARQVANILKTTFPIVKDRLFKEELLFQLELGNVTTEELIQEFQKLSPHPLPRKEFLSAFNQIFRENEEIAPIITSLKRQGKKLLLLSNISEPHFNYVYQTFPLLHQFDKAILSYQVRHAKPYPEIYHAVLQEANCQPFECFYTDDIVGHVESAKSLFIDAELFVSSEKLIEQLAKRMVFV